MISAAAADRKPYINLAPNYTPDVLSPGWLGWPLPTFGSHPRIMMDATRKSQLAANFTTYSSILGAGVSNFADTSNTDPFVTSLRYQAGLTTPTGTQISNIITTVLADPISGAPLYNNSAACLYADRAAFVLDWMYPLLSGTQISNLVSNVESRVASLASSLFTISSGGYQFHESHLKGFFGFMIGQIAIQGETGATDRKQIITNCMQNWLAQLEELFGDGSMRDYLYQDPLFQVLPIIWEIATGQKISSKFGVNRAEAIARLVAVDGSGYQREVASNNDQWDNGFAYRVSAACGHYAVSGYYGNSLASWAGDQLGQTTWENGSIHDIRWIALACRNSALASQSPSTLSLPLFKSWQNEGIVSFRDAWSAPGAANRDTMALAHFGAGTPHAQQVSGHLEIFRGVDDLIVRGTPYASRTNTNAFYNFPWGSENSFHFNTLNFNPTGASSPDFAGSQGPKNNGLPNDLDGTGGSNPTFASAPVSQAYLQNNSTIRGEVFRAGRIRYCNFDSAYASGMVVGECTNSYTWNTFQLGTITNYERRIAYVVASKVFIVRDLFTISGIAALKQHWHGRVKPTISSPTTVSTTPARANSIAYTPYQVVSYPSGTPTRVFQCITGGTSALSPPAGLSSATMGSQVTDGTVTWLCVNNFSSSADIAAAGIYTSASGTFTFVRGNSQATVQLVTPAPSGITANRILGGPGWENMIDGVDWNPYLNTDAWPVGAVNVGQWRVEYEMTPAQAAGEILTVITVGANGDSIPNWTRSALQTLYPPIFA